jgi:hypothetical protein
MNASLNTTLATTQESIYLYTTQRDKVAKENMKSVKEEASNAHQPNQRYANEESGVSTRGVSSRSVRKAKEERE